MSMCSRYFASRVGAGALTRSDSMHMLVGAALSAVRGAANPLWKLLQSYTPYPSIHTAAQISLLELQEVVEKPSVMSSDAAEDSPAPGNPCRQLPARQRAAGHGRRRVYFDFENRTVKR